ncbi:hypothetical protein [Vibrio amylolyticus]|uniref:hypothetical protein n=1 Tax=Vibrio amylolyticus TaxID=2847292 RepID=UPI003558793F
MRTPAHKLILLTALISSLVSFGSLGAEQPQKTTGIQTYSEIMAHGQEVFNRYGISDDLPRLGLSSLTAGEHLVEHVERQITIGDQVRKSRVFLVKDTDEKGNIDLRIKYNPSELDEQDDAISEIERNTRTEYRLRDYAQSYDPTSVTATDMPDGTSIVSFNYSKYGLPQDIAYFRFMRVDVTVKDGVPLLMTITNAKPFDYDGVRVASYRQTITFATLDSGKLILFKKEIDINGSKRNQPVHVSSVAQPVALYSEERGVDIIHQALLTEVSDPRIREVSVKLDRIFPLMGDIVRRKGIDLPLPYGVSVAYRSQNMNIPFNDFTIDGVRLNDLFDPEDSIGTVKAESLNIRGDINILPFWNVFGYIGKINVDAKVDAEYTGAAGEFIRDKLNQLPALPGRPGLGDKFCDSETYGRLCHTSNVGIPLHLEYDLRGVGTTLSVGYREFFASVTGTVSQTRLKGTTQWGDPIATLQPMLGYQLVDYRAQLFVGAEYQGLEPRLDGHVKADDIEFDYDIGVDLNKWAYVVGFNKQFGRNYNLTYMFNKGETRDSMTLNFGYRF